MNRKSHDCAPDRHARRRAFTLLETVIATAVFVILAAGVLSTTVMARRAMNHALIRNTAFDAAQGFLDQIKGGVKFETLLSTTPASAIPAIPANPGGAGVPATPATPAIPANPGGTLIITGLKFAPGTISVQPINLKATKPGQGGYTAYNLPLNSTDSTEANALANIAFVPSFQVKLELSRIDDIAVNGQGNAVLVTLRYQYKNNAYDTDYHAGAVSYIAPRTSL